MAKSPTAPTTAPDTVWLARGRHLGPGAEETVRRRLWELKSSDVIQDHLEFDASGDDPTTQRAFEARWLVDDDIVVRARLNVEAASDASDDTRHWMLVAEADRPWDLSWPSPATVFWPEEADAPWDHDIVPGLRFREINPLPADDRALRRLLKECARHSWSIHVVVHEAMTPDERGLRPLAPLLPPSLRHRIMEHRAAPEQFQVVNWALYDLGVRVPRGGAVVLPRGPAAAGSNDKSFSVRSVFLDGSLPTELIETVQRAAQSPAPLPDGAPEALSELREQWHLTTLQEELAMARSQAAAYAEALEAMTRSRDLYQEAAELAHEALAAYRESYGALPSPRQEPRKREGFSLRSLVRPLDRMREGAKLLRTSGAEDGAPGTTSPDGESAAAGPGGESAAPGSSAEPSEVRDRQ
ncbi:hypothetical protein [Streptomyces chiangmaiensis]|uniref:PE-PGRS family protein n=1 Tax=Streptomyces chiangmaiensis TaxID=766497 RepID=A0ABU7FET8_9ACTN|nr:hypothetical protein [Streptomyces chiangmaiensis]MED7821868.1 hypothetical protein [Streptomyces chiangmaiensis]